MRPERCRCTVRNERSSHEPGRRSLHTMRCSVARLCERTVGRRVPLLGAGGGLLHTTPHCVVVTVSGAELASYASHTERRLVQRVRSWGDMESATLPCGGGWRGRSLSVVGNGRSRELCEALELVPTTLHADHMAVNSTETAHAFGRLATDEAGQVACVHHRSMIFLRKCGLGFWIWVRNGG
jgi:hypothetical protein